MAEDLVVKIGADADDFVKETSRARDAFGRFSKSVEDDAKDATQAFARVSRSSKSLSRQIGDSFKAIQNASRRGGAGAAFKTLNSEVAKATKGFGTLRGAASKVGLRALGGGATVALEGFKKLTIAAGALGAVLAGIGIKSATSFAKFETAFAQVRTLLPPTFKDVEELEKGVRDLSKQFGTDLVENTRAAYQAISQGAAPAETVAFLEQAFKAASAGATGSVEAVNLLLASLNAFGAPIQEAGRFSDVFFNTIAKGATTAEELSASIGQIAPIANAAGVSFEEVTAALAALTLGGVNTAEASTQLKNTIAGIVSPSGEAAAALEEIGVNAKLLREQGLEEAFKRLEEATGGSLDALTKFLPNIRAAQGGASLAGGQFENFNKILASNRDALGRTGEAAGKTGATLSKSFGRLSATINDAFVSIGKLLSTALGPGLDSVTDFVDAAQGEIELLAQAFESTFGNEIAAFFDSLKGESETAGTVVGTALRAIGEGLFSLSEFIEDNKSAIATFGTLYRAQLAIAEGAIAAVALVAGGLAKALTVLLGVGASVASIFSDEVATGFREASDLANSLGDTLVDFSADRFVGAFDGLSELDETFDSIKSAAEGASTGLDSAARGAQRLGDSVDDLSAKQDAAAASQRMATNAREAAAAASVKQAIATGNLTALSKEASGATSGLSREVDAAGESADRTSSKLDALGAATRRTADGQRELTSALEIFNETTRIGLQAELGRRIESLAVTSENVSGRVADAFRIVDTVLKGQFREAGEEAVETFARTGEASAAFADRIRALENIQVTFLDASVFDGFIEASGKTSAILQNFRGETLETFQVISNVLTGDFRKAGDELVKSFARGKVSSREFRTEVERLASLQLGFDELFRDVNSLADGFESLRDQVEEAEGILGSELRDSVQQAKEAFEEGKISLDDYLGAIRQAGDASREFSDLSETQLVAFKKVREENEELADTILDLAKNLDGSLIPAFEDYLKAVNQDGLATKDLGKALDDLKKKNEDLTKATKETSAAQRDNASAANEARSAQEQYEDALDGLRDAFEQVNAQQQLQFELLAVGKENYFDAATGVKLLNEGNVNLFNSTNKLGAALDDVGKEKLSILTRGLASGTLSTDQFRSAVKQLAQEFGVLADQAERSNARIQKAFSGSNRLSAFGSPGGIQFDSFGKADAGASVFGTRRVTGSSNFQSEEEARLGAQLGLGPKALRQRLARQGFVDGGPVLSTGRPDVEAGEFVLSQRGLSDFGKLVATLLNSGRGSTVVNQTNTFPINGVTPEGSGGDMVNELAFKLRPALDRAGRLAASRSPIR